MHGVEEALKITCVEFGDGGRLASVVLILAPCKPGS